MEVIKILISVKTYPVASEKYIELACTAGFKEDGSWIRLYPIPFRLLDGEKQYKKYQWIEAKIEKSRQDNRPESFKILDYAQIKPLNLIKTNDDWAERKRLILDKNIIYTSLAEIIDKAHKNEISLAIFKPTKIIDFIVEKTESEWSAEKLDKIYENAKQFDLFEENQRRENFKIVDKVPYKFSFKFSDVNGKESTLMIEDWETGVLFWNCKRRYQNEEIAAQKVKEKYFNDFAKTKDLHFFLGTTLEHHNRKAKNPFIIIGTFHPPHQLQASLF